MCCHGCREGALADRAFPSPLSLPPPLFSFLLFFLPYHKKLPLLLEVTCRELLLTEGIQDQMSILKQEQPGTSWQNGLGRYSLQLGRGEGKKPDSLPGLICAAANPLPAPAYLCHCAVVAAALLPSPACPGRG